MTTKPKRTCARPGCDNTAKYAVTGLCETHYLHLHRIGLIRNQPTDKVDPPTRHIEQFMQQGYTRAAIARAAGVDPGTINRALAGETITRRVRDALLATDINQAPMHPAWRVTRRIRALAAAGHTLDTISEHTGVEISVITKLAHAQRATVTRRVFASVDAYYRKHADDIPQPPSTRIKKYGWAVPWEWDNIDGPDDLHGDALVNPRTAQQAIRDAIERWGEPHTARILETKRDKLTRFLDVTAMRQSTKAAILAKLTTARNRARETPNPTNTPHHQQQ